MWTDPGMGYNQLVMSPLGLAYTQPMAVELDMFSNITVQPS